MKTIYHSSESRGHADHGWLNAYHTFSFANYYNPDRVLFGTLRVLNDDTIAGGMGFSKHPHSNMEIITIPLSGDLKHEDSMGNVGIISKGEIQVMSAGTGVIHSEKNVNADRPAKILQIWVIPNKENVSPRYQQICIDTESKTNDFQQILSPNPEDEGAWIHQEAWFSMARFEAGHSQTYHWHNKGNGVYIFVIEGKAKVGEQILNRCDGLGITETDQFQLEALEDSQILIMEISMELPK